MEKEGETKKKWGNERWKKGKIGRRSDERGKEK